METIDNLLWNHHLANQLVNRNAIRHYIGGPVGMPNRGPASEVLVMHHMGNVTGAKQLIAAAAPPPPPPTAAGLHDSAARNAVAALGRLSRGTALEVMTAQGETVRHRGGHAHLRGRSRRRSPGGNAVPASASSSLYMGGHLDEILYRVQQGVASGGDGWGNHAAVGTQLRLFHGICAWAQGQLEGEVRTGAWGLCKASVDDIITTTPQQLWQTLHVSNRTRWL